ncbi:hypothetical protein AB0M72_06890 [Nocardiopsis dassonvillei]
MPDTSLRCMSVNAWRSGTHTPDSTYDNRLPALCTAQQHRWDIRATASSVREEP